jgi:hypothetical protein
LVGVVRHVAELLAFELAVSEELSGGGPALPLRTSLQNPRCALCCLQHM